MHIFLRPLCRYLTACLLQELKHRLLTLHSLPLFVLDVNLGVVYHAFKKLEHILLSLDAAAFLPLNTLTQLSDLILKTGVHLLANFDTLCRPRFNQFL